MKKIILISLSFVILLSSVFIFSNNKKLIFSDYLLFPLDEDTRLNNYDYSFGISKINTLNNYNIHSLCILGYDVRVDNIALHKTIFPYIFDFRLITLLTELTGHHVRLIPPLFVLGHVSCFYSMASKQAYRGLWLSKLAFLSDF